MTDQPLLAFTATGRPAPQGSLRPRPVYVGRKPNRRFTGRVDLVDDNAARLHPWRDNVTYQAMDAAQRQGIREPLEGPFRLDVTFLIPRPKGHYRAGRNGHLLAANAPNFPIPKRRDDLDKLVRAVMDAITVAKVWHDDAQVAAIQARKVYAELGEQPGIRVVIDHLSQLRFGVQRPPDLIHAETLPIPGEVL